MPDSIIWVKFADSIKVRYILNYYLLTMTKIKSLDELRQKKQQLEQSLEIREKSDHPESMIQVRVAMATCGIASGARTVMNAFVEKIRDEKIPAVVTQTGCMGYCYAEPTVEVKKPGQDPVVFSYVDVKK